MRAFLAIALASLVLPAAADASYTRIVNRENGWCLEGNQAGDVYVNPCAGGNGAQIWERWDGGWTRNVGTGLCLKADGKLTPDSIHAAPCVWAEPRLNWLHWYGGWYERAAFDAVAAECLSRLPSSEHDVTGIACENPNGPNPPAEEWYAVEASLPAPPAPPPPPPPPPNPCVPAAPAQGLKLRVGFRHSRRVAHAPYGARRRVHGRLVTADGKPVPGVGFCVGEQRSERGPVRPVGLVVSDAHGRFGYTIGRGPSRRFWFVHSAGGSSTASSVVLRVRAPVRLGASSRSLRNGQSLVLRGRLRGVRGRSLLVEIQVWQNGRWETKDTRRTGRGGRFRWSYRFVRTFGTLTYRFRARVSAQPGLPFSTGASRVVGVRVSG
jgi:hypothetical protein